MKEDNRNTSADLNLYNSKASACYNPPVLYLPNYIKYLGYYMILYLYKTIKHGVLGCQTRKLFQFKTTKHWH